MNIIIYNINSFGGNYEYSKYIFEAYTKNAEVSKCVLLMPSNASVENKNIVKNLITDLPSFSIKLFKKIHFVYRSLMNPLRLLKYLKSQEPSVVLFNDYDQVTAQFWIPFFRRLKKKHLFATILHDPDRDKFFRIQSLSESSMESIMSIMDVAFYHGYLPQKSYYDDASLKVKVPHGTFESGEYDEGFCASIKQKAKSNHLIGILGNIRDEKNYKLVIDALQKLENVKLLVAGNAANSSVSAEEYKAYAIQKGVEDKIIWIIKFLSEAEFNAAINACDIILLYYKASFTSQSGVLMQIAPFEKKLIISDSESSLKESVVQYQIGKVVPNEDADSLAAAIETMFVADDPSLSSNWKSYKDDLSWDKHVQIAMEQYKKVWNER